MSENKIPKILPIKLKEYETQQSKYDIVPKIPFRSIVLGPSGSGKKNNITSNYDFRYV